MENEKHIIPLEWHKFTWTDRPNRSGTYFVIAQSGWITTLDYDLRHDAFCYDRETGSEVKVAYWAEIPDQIISLKVKTIKEFL